MAKVTIVQITNKRVLKNIEDVQNEVIGKIFLTKWNDKIKKEIIEKLDNVTFKHKVSDKATYATMDSSKLIMELTNSGFYLKDQQQKDLIVHEFMHLVTDTYFRRSQGHNRNYKTICYNLGYGEEVSDRTMTTSDSDYTDGYTEPNNYKYKVVCLECGRTTSKYKRKVDRSNYTSRCCRAKLRVEKI